MYFLATFAFTKVYAQKAQSLSMGSHYHFPLFSQNGGTGNYLQNGISNRKVISYKNGSGIGLHFWYRSKSDSSSIGFETGLMNTFGNASLFSELKADTFPYPWNFSEIKHHSIVVPLGFYLPYKIKKMSFSSSFGILIPIYRRSIEKEFRFSAIQEAEIKREIKYRYSPGLYFNQQWKIPINNHWSFNTSIQYSFIATSRSKRNITQVTINGESKNINDFYPTVIEREQIYLTNKEITQKEFLNDPNTNPSRFQSNRPLESTPFLENLSVLGIQFVISYWW